MRIENGTLYNATNVDIENGTLKIPESVTRIANNALSNYTDLTEIIIPEGVKSIGESAFSYCSSLTKITLPESLTSIELGAFFGCSSLTEITIPEGVTNIGRRVFEGCSSLTKITLPESITSIERSAFSGCSSLTKITLPEGLTSIENYTFLDCFNLTEIVIPEEVTNIGRSAFSGCSSLIKITLPESARSIGHEAFSGCSSLTEITIPEGLTSIEFGVFEGCSSLTEITIPEGVWILGESAFSGCSSLTKITLPKSLTSIEFGAFRNCDNLTEIVIPEEVTRIGNSAFSGCSSLTKITLPEGLTNIEDNTFSDCSSLTKITLPEGLTSIEFSAFSGCSSLTEITLPKGVTIIEDNTFKDCSSLTKITLPEGLTSIEFGAFEGCSSLTEITIPEGITSIGGRAFTNCSSLTKITIPEGVRGIGESTFSGCRSLAKITIPENLETVGVNCFLGCDSLEEIVLPIEISENVIEQLYMSYAPVKEKMFGKDLEKVEKLKEKNREILEIDEEYEERQMDIFYYRMLKSIGIEETERILELPNLTEEEIRNYVEEKNEVFKNLYELKMHIEGHLGITLQIFKAIGEELKEIKKEEKTKNTAEQKIFREINRLIESGEEYTLTELIEESIKTAGYKIKLEKIRQIEEEINSQIIKKNLEKIEKEIEEKLSEDNEEEIGIVEEQVKPIRIMIENAIKEVMRKGKITEEEILIEIDKKLEEAHSPYVRQNKEKIKTKMKNLLKEERIKNLLTYTAVTALRETKEKIGGAWKYKINRTLQELGYTFDNLPKEFRTEEIEQIKERLKIDIEVGTRAELKSREKRAEAYRMLSEYGSVVTYKQIHDMFGEVREPYSEEFKEFFKKHREEFLEVPEYCFEFGRIHNNFERIINSKELKNLYKAGKLEISDIMGYLEKIEFANQREGNEELAKLAVSVGKITTEKEFEHVQDLFEITKRRERTSIPPIKVKGKKYEGRMLDPDEVLNLFSGNITTCCQRFNDIGEGAMSLGSIEENAGIFVIEEIGENGERNIVAQSLTIRQKGVSGIRDRLCFDNIEIPETKLGEMTDEDHEEILKIYQEAGRKAIELDRKFLGRLKAEGKITQEQYDEYILKEVIAGTGYNDLKGLKELHGAEVVVAEEAYNTYKTIKGNYINPWLDSTGGKAPMGSEGMPVIIAEMTREEREEIAKRKADKEIGKKEIPLWYNNVKKAKTYINGKISGEEIEIIKNIEKQAYRDGQVLNNDIQSIKDIESIYGITDAKIVIGGNKDWYLIYGENYEGDIEISDLAMLGAINAEKKGEERQGNIKIATAEAALALYRLLVEAEEKGKGVHCDATRGTSLVNIKRMLKKGLVTVYDNYSNEIIYDDKKGLVYSESGEEVRYGQFRDNSDIEMLGLYIQPDVEKMKAEIKKVEELLDKVIEAERLKGKEKEEGLDELRDSMRRRNNTNDER